MRKAFLIVFIALLTFVAVDRGSGQDRDTTSAITEEEPVKRHAVEFGLNTLGAGVEYRYRLVTFFTVDVVFAAGPPGIGVGVSFVPLTYVFAQGVYGTSSYQEVAVIDGPVEFRPDFAYGWRAGAHVPLNPQRSSFFLVLSGGDVWLVQNEYCSNCGGFLTGAPPAPEYGREKRHFRV